MVAFAFDEPKVVTLFFDGQPIGNKLDELAPLLARDFRVQFAGPHSGHSAGTKLAKAPTLRVLQEIAASFPNFTFNPFRTAVSKRTDDGAFGAAINCAGDFTGVPYKPLADCPPLEPTGKHYELGPEMVKMYVDRHGRASKLVFEALSTGGAVGLGAGALYEAAGGSLPNPNLVSAGKTFEAQRLMAMGNVDERMMAEFGSVRAPRSPQHATVHPHAPTPRPHPAAQVFAAKFSPRCEFVVNPRGVPPGPSVVGDFGAAVEAVFPIWSGFVNTKAENVSIVERSEDVIVVRQRYDSHLLDATGKPIAGSENVNFGCTHTLTYSGAMIVRWVQEFDASRLQRSRDVAEAHAADVAATRLQSVSRGQSSRKEVASRTFMTSSLTTALGEAVPRYNLPLEAKYAVEAKMQRVAATRERKALWSAGTAEFAPPPELIKTIEPKGGAADSRLLKGKSRQLVQGYLADNHPVFGTARRGY